MLLSRRQIANEINSFNNACFKTIETMKTDGSVVGVFYHFIASEFALMGIKRFFGEEFIGTTSTGYYLDYLRYRNYQRHLAHIAA